MYTSFFVGVFYPPPEFDANQNGKKDNNSQIERIPTGFRNYTIPLGLPTLSVCQSAPTIRGA
jgi:hypothetical protein